MDHKPVNNDFVLEMSSRQEDLPQHFDTPTWLRPVAPGTPEATEAEAGTAVKTPPAIPHQAGPVRDEARPRASRPAIPDEARWKAKHKVRTFFALLLVPLLAGAVAGGYYAWSIGSMEYIPAAAIPALVIVGIWGAMINTAPVVTTLKGSRISVRHDGVTDEFDLANPDQAVETTRNAGDPKWRVILERMDGSELVLTRKHVPPAEFTTILQHYRQIAAELLEQRVRRYQGY